MSWTATAIRTAAAVLGLPGLRTGYFRGVPFRIDSYEFASGRRAEVHEYALRDEPNPEDLGRKARRLSFSAYVIGPTWEMQRNALLDACEAEGSGLLIHPYLGQFMALCLNVTVSESRQGGHYIGQFDLEFVEDGGFTYPTSTPNANRGVYSATDAGFPACQDAFAGSFAVNGFAGFVAGDAVLMTETLVDDVRLYIDRSVFDAGALAILDQTITAWIPNTEAFVRQEPTEVAASLAGFLRDVGDDVLPDPPDAITAMAVFAAWTPALPDVFYPRIDNTGLPIYTPTRAQQQRNRDAMIALVRRASVLTAAGRLPDFRTDSSRVARNVRDSFTASIGPVIDRASELNDGTVRALRRLDAASTALLTARIAPIADQDTAAQSIALPSLAAAHALYRDARRVADLKSANPVPHPSFMPRILMVPR